MKLVNFLAIKHFVYNKIAGRKRLRLTHSSIFCKLAEVDGKKVVTLSGNLKYKKLFWESNFEFFRYSVPSLNSSFLPLRFDNFMIKYIVQYK